MGVVAWWNANAAESREATPYRAGFDQERGWAGRARAEKAQAKMCDIKWWWVTCTCGFSSRPPSVEIGLVRTQS